MKLYYAPGTCALSVWMSLEWAGAEYEVQRVELGSSEYKKINPLGAVPALDTGDGKIKTQANAILQYIADLYPEANLGPDEDVEDKFLFNELAAFLTGDYHPAFWPLFGPAKYTISNEEKALDDVKKASFKQIDKVVSHLDDLLEGKDHIYKDKKTVLDPYAFVLTRWTVKTPKSWEEYPNVARFMKRMQEDEAVKKVLEISSK